MSADEEGRLDPVREARLRRIERRLGLVLVHVGGSSYKVRRAGDPPSLTVLQGGQGGTDAGPAGDETGGDRTGPGRP